MELDSAAEMARSEPLAVVSRGGHAESVHRGHVAVVDAGGALVAWAGDPDLFVFPRSAFKPFQSLPLVESGVFARSGLGPGALALISGSHGGTDRHAALALSILARAGLDESALRCGSHTPYDEATAAALRARGEAPSPLRHNCSGKHAGMLLMAHETGAPTASYIEPSHPVQRRIFERFEALVDEPFADPVPAIDGCSAPTPRMPLRTLARAFALLATARDHAGRPVEGLATIRDAMRAHPENVAGEGRLDTMLMRAVANAVSKAGAEGVHATGLLDRGLGIAVKIEDGSRRALGPAAVSTLGELGVLDAAAREALAAQAEERLRNFAGITVGAIRGIARLHREGE
ncbi:MAG TPA: asparaginase [Candidatus Eisenbacteria bacterium]